MNSGLKTGLDPTRNGSPEIRSDEGLSPVGGCYQVQVEGRCGDAKGKGTQLFNHLVQGKHFYFKP